MNGNSDKNGANLGDLISRIKSEGVEEASKKADEIISRAKNEAAEIVDEARNKAEQIVAEADREAEVRTQRGLESLKLAARDSTIALRRSMEQMFGSIILRECNEALTGEALKSLIGKIVEAWHEPDKEHKGLEILLSDKELKGLSDSFIKELGKAIENGVQVKSRKGLKGGFRAGLKGEEMYYDFSDDAVAELLFNYLAPQVADILEERSEGEEGK